MKPVPMGGMAGERRVGRPAGTPMDTEAGGQVPRGLSATGLPWGGGLGGEDWGGAEGSTEVKGFPR